MEWKAKPAGTREAWLNELGRRLVWYFPANQTQDILSDYREQFDVGHDHCRTEAEIIQGLGTPAEAVALLLEEEPSAKNDCWRRSALWGAMLAVFCAFLWVCLNAYPSGLFWIEMLVSLPLLASVLFLLLRGPARVELEKQSEKNVPPVSIYYVPFALTLFFEAAEQILLALSLAGRLPEYIGGMFIGKANTWFVLAMELVMAALAVWLLYKSVTASLRYFPGVIHTAAAGGSIFLTYVFLTDNRLDPVFLLSLDMLLRLAPYVAGLVTALVFQRWIDGRKPLPRLFRDREVSWQEWRYRLVVRLLGWYSAEQALEILEDYQEQYELGREQGKSEDTLLSEMGRPEAIVRDLLAEDRRARLNRRKQWPWIAAAAVSAWLLLGYVSAFDFGAIGAMGVNWMLYGPDAWKPGLIALSLGTAALFVLLRARERAAVERQFPARQKPTLWLLILPLACSVLVEGIGLQCIYAAPSKWEPVFLGQSLVWYFITVIEFSLLLLTVLLIWTLARCFSGSIRHLPAMSFIAGSLAQVACAGIYLSAMDLEFISEDLNGCVRAFLASLWPLAVGVLLAAVSWLTLRAASKKED